MRDGVKFEENMLMKLGKKNSKSFKKPWKKETWKEHGREVLSKLWSPSDRQDELFFAPALFLLPSLPPFLNLPNRRRPAYSFFTFVLGGFVFCSLFSRCFFFHFSVFVDFSVLDFFPDGVEGEGLGRHFESCIFYILCWFFIYLFIHFLIFCSMVYGRDNVNPVFSEDGPFSEIRDLKRYVEQK